MSVKPIVRRLFSALDEIAQCCEVIKDSEKGCSECPLRNNCFEESTLEAFWADVPFDKATEFFTVADELTCYFPSTQEEWDAREADVRRNDPEDWD